MKFKTMINLCMEPMRIGSLFVRSVISCWPNTSVGFWLRRAYARSRGASIGDNALIHRSCDVSPWSLVTMGKNSSLADGAVIALGPGDNRLVIGDDTFIGPEIYVRNMNHAFERTDIPIMEQGHIGTDIVIGNGVWMGARCILLSGARIGDHSVVAAGSVLSNEIAPYSVAAGNPARVVKKRIVK